MWHNIWVQCGRPKNGPVADIMRRTRANYHYNVRRVKSHVKDISRQRFAEAVLRDNARDFLVGGATYRQEQGYAVQCGRRSLIA